MLLIGPCGNCPGYANYTGHCQTACFFVSGFLQSGLHSPFWISSFSTVCEQGTSCYSIRTSEIGEKCKEVSILLNFKTFKHISLSEFLIINEIYFQIIKCVVFKVKNV